MGHWSSLEQDVLFLAVSFQLPTLTKVCLPAVSSEKTHDWLESLFFQED
jgi:hypothetical protein